MDFKGNHRILLATISICNLFAGFLLQWFTFSFLGAGREADALYSAIAVPQMVILVLSGALTNVLIPMLAIEGKERQSSLTWTFILFLSFVYIAIAFPLWITTSSWLPLLLPGFDEKGIELAGHLTKIQLLGLLFSAIGGIQLGLMTARQKVIQNEIINLCASIACLFFVFLSVEKIGIDAIAWGYVLKSFLATILGLPYTGIPRILNLKDKTFRLVAHRVMPLLVGSVYYKSDPVVDRYLLSFSPPGVPAIFFLAYALVTAGASVMSKSIIGPDLRSLALSANTDYPKGFRLTYYACFRRIVLFSILFIVVFFIAGTYILSLLFEYKKMSSTSISTLWTYILLFSGFLLGGLGGQLTSTAFYSIGDTKTPSLVGIGAFTIAIPIKFLFYNLGGAPGLVLAVSTYYLLSCMIQALILKRRLSLFKATNLSHD